MKVNGRRKIITTYILLPRLHFHTLNNWVDKDDYGDEEMTTAQLGNQRLVQG